MKPDTKEDVSDERQTQYTDNASHSLLTFAKAHTAGLILCSVVSVLLDLDDFRSILILPLL